MVEYLLGFLFLGLVLGPLSYTAWAVMGEESSYRRKARPVVLGPYTLPVPSWWPLVHKAKDFVRFERDKWFCEFRLLPHAQEGRKAILWGKARERGILFDPGEGIPYAPFRQSESLEMVRMEGTALGQESRRIYGDLALLWPTKAPGPFLLVQSESPILEGMVEGPYLEKALWGSRYRSNGNRLPQEDKALF